MRFSVMLVGFLAMLLPVCVLSSCSGTITTSQADAADGGTVDATADTTLEAARDAAPDIQSDVAISDLGADIAEHDHATPESGACGPATCEGCCDAKGACLEGAATSACGAGGKPCRNCHDVGADCDPVAHDCLPPQDCGPWNCDGCCTWMFTCLQGTSESACGKGGEFCKNCYVYTGLCDADEGACVVPTACGPDDCEGCCDKATGACLEGTSAVSCGRGGEACRACDAPGSCTGAPGGGGICLGPPLGCAPGDCDGCCACLHDGEPCECWPGVEWYACGHGGQLCQFCNEEHTGCEPLAGDAGGICVTQLPPEPPSCGTWNCPGCCTNTEPPHCVYGYDESSCGHEGMPCEACGPEQTCEPLPLTGGGRCVG